MLGIVLVAACKDPAGSDGGALQIAVLEWTEADTAGSATQHVLTVRVHTANDRPAAGRRVTVLEPSGSGLLHLVSVAGVTDSLDVMTDADGVAQARYVVGTRARSALIRIMVEGQFGRVLTVHVRPASPWRFREVPPGRILLGESLPISPVAEDRHGNRVTDAVQCESDGAAVRVAADCTLIADQLGVVELTRRAGNMVETTTIHVSRIAPGVGAAIGTSLVVLPDDRTFFASLYYVPAGGLLESAWSLANDAVVFTVGPRLHTLERMGSAHRLLPEVAGVIGEINPVFDAAGDWLYYVALTTGGGSEIWRARPDGSDAGRVGRPSSGAAERDVRPAPSPDGRNVAFARLLDGRWWLHVLDLQTGQDRKLDVEIRASSGIVAQMSGTIVWNPDGGRIGFMHVGWVMTVRPDGSDARVLPYGGENFDFSPDGRSILLGGRLTGGRLERVELDTGVRSQVPNSNANFMMHPAWIR